MVCRKVAWAPSLTFFALLLGAQQKSVLEFDVASVRTNKEGGFSTSQRNVRGKVDFRNCPLRTIILSAYSIETQLLSGEPSWTMAERFDIDAVVEEDPAIGGEKALERNRLRLRVLLEKRFQLRVHAETKILPSYVLVVGKRGPKLKVAKPGSQSAARLSRSRDHLEWRAEEIDVFADFLWSELGQPVFNQTGLKEDYDFDLDFEPERQDPSPDPSKQPLKEGARPSIFVAIQDQLGLKLEARKMPVDLLVVDHVERPSAN